MTDTPLIESAPADPPSAPTARRRPPSRVWTGVLWVLAVASAAAAIALPLAGTVAILLMLPVAVIHGLRRYGVKTMVFFFVVTFVVSNVFENLSIVTGFPFGNYHYTGAFQLIYVPVQIGLFYFGIGYISWQVANVLLDEADTRLGWRSGVRNRINVVALPVVAATVMTMTDLGRDSIASTVNKSWIWEDGGGVFGVPFTNYLGWWLVTYIFFQIVAIFLARRAAPVASEGRVSLLQPVIVYAGVGLGSISYFAVAAGTPATDGAGVVWDGHALNETMMTINLFTVVAVAVFAVIKLARNDAASIGRTPR